MEINKVICDIKNKYYKSRFKLFGSTEYETQEYRDVKFTCPEKDEYIIRHSKSELVDTLFGDVFMIALLFFANYSLIPEILYSPLCIALIVINIFVINDFIKHIKLYNKPKIVLIANKDYLQFDELSIDWKYILTLHFYEFTARGPAIFNLTIHYIDIDSNILKKVIDLKHLNYEPRQICNILSKYYLYENVYRTDY
jgi:hypothetical protein